MPQTDDGAQPGLYALELADISGLGLGRLANDLVDLRQRVRRRRKPGDRVMGDQEVTDLIGRLLWMIEHETDRRDRAAELGPFSAEELRGR